MFSLLEVEPTSGSAGNAARFSTIIAGRMFERNASKLSAPGGAE